MSGRRSRRAVPRAERVAPRPALARMCVSCRRLRPKGEMIRVVRDAMGTVGVDRTGRMPGRGAYVCPDEACVALAGRRLGGALRGGRVDGSAITAELRAVGA